MSILPTDKKIYFIIGPTGTGKSSLAVELAKKILKAEIISADSRQIYKDLDISSGKITKDEMEGIPHHMLDIANLGDFFSVVDYTNLALEKIAEIYERGNVPIVCGGTGLYIDHLLYKIELPKVNINTKLREDLINKNSDELYEILEQLLTPSPLHGASLKKTNPKNIQLNVLRLEKVANRPEGVVLEKFQNKEFKNNKVRLVRAIEIITGLGYYPEAKKEKRFTNTEIILTTLDKTDLKDKILKRTLERLGSGMLEEIINLKIKYNLTDKYLKSLGFEYSLCLEFINSGFNSPSFTKGWQDLQNLDGVVKKFLEDFVTKEYQYAKRQITWFKKYKNISNAKINS
jgi:tRNA dimethylallyltransferase